jgi:hypothetical protein
MILDEINKKAINFGLKIRFVEESDAEKILQLRTNEKLTKHIHATDSDLNKQIDYIRSYKNREKVGVEYYLAFLSLENVVLGFYRLHKIDNINKSFTIGSWIFDPKLTDLTPIYADILSKEFGFNDLGLETCYFDVRINNKKVFKYHQLFGPVFMYDDEEENNFFYLKKEVYNKNVTDILKLLI